MLHYGIPKKKNECNFHLKILIGAWNGACTWVGTGAEQLKKVLAQKPWLFLLSRNFYFFYFKPH